MDDNKTATLSLTWAQTKRLLAHAEAANHRIARRMLDFASSTAETSDPKAREEIELWSRELSANLHLIKTLRGAFKETSS